MSRLKVLVQVVLVLIGSIWIDITGDNNNG